MNYKFGVYGDSIAFGYGNNSFDETILGLLDIATQAGDVFEKSNNLELKRLLLKFVFESLTLTEATRSHLQKYIFLEIKKIIFFDALKGPL